MWQLSERDTKVAAIGWKQNQLKVAPSFLDLEWISAFEWPTTIIIGSFGTGLDWWIKKKKLIPFFSPSLLGRNESVMVNVGGAFKGGEWFLFFKKRSLLEFIVHLLHRHMRQWGSNSSWRHLSPIFNIPVLKAYFSITFLLSIVAKLLPISICSCLLSLFDTKYYLNPVVRLYTVLARGFFQHLDITEIRKNIFRVSLLLIYLADCECWLAPSCTAKDLSWKN